MELIFMTESQATWSRATSLIEAYCLSGVEHSTGKAHDEGNCQVYGLGAPKTCRFRFRDAGLEAASKVLFLLGLETVEDAYAVACVGTRPQ